MNDAVFTSSAITAHRAVFMLNNARIQAMIRARDLASAIKVLQECGYQKLSVDIDDIINTEREHTMEKFASLCHDNSVLFCVQALYNFSMIKLANDVTYEMSEARLYSALSNYAKSIKSNNIRQYFEYYTDCLKRDEKLDEHKLWNFACNMKLAMEGTEPLVYWYLLKQVEFTAVRIILAGKKFGYTREQIMENLGGLCDRF